MWISITCRGTWEPQNNEQGISNDEIKNFYIRNSSTGMPLALVRYWIFKFIMKKEIIIIGGGVSGITTALTLQLLGYETICYAEYLVNENAPLDPRFASLYPAASIIPHSVQTKELDTLFPASLAIFKMLHRQGMNSMNVHRHYEVFEFPKDRPAYTNYLHNYTGIKKDEPATFPHRLNAPELYGWHFDCFVARWPAYMHQLYDLYKNAGGTIRQQKIGHHKISELPAAIIINCSGAWSNNIFKDNAAQEFIRGHLVYILDKKPVVTTKNEICSYNYTPAPSVYAKPDGSPSDVYFYPVGDKWILGGSRQAGVLDNAGQWKGKVHNDTIAINNLDVPRQILELNDDILKNTFGKTIASQSSAIYASMGYRFSRNDSKNGLRLEAAEEHGKKIIHNYGHGGAGVALSWGCALNVLKLITNETDNVFQAMPRQPSFTLLDNLQVKLQKVYLELLQ
jgi:glycine/D-amino acid oxidase-like deaminating enzyme